MTDFLGRSPLLAAVEEKKPNVVRYLLRNGANVNFVTPNTGQNVLWHCKSTAMLKLLMTGGSKDKPDLWHRSASTKNNCLAWHCEDREVKNYPILLLTREISYRCCKRSQKYS